MRHFDAQLRFVDTLEKLVNGNPLQSLPDPVCLSCSLVDHQAYFEEAFHGAYLEEGMGEEPYLVGAYQEGEDLGMKVVF